MWLLCQFEVIGFPVAQSFITKNAKRQFSSEIIRRFKIQLRLIICMCCTISSFFAVVPLGLGQLCVWWVRMCVYELYQQYTTWRHMGENAGKRKKKRIKRHIDHGYRSRLFTVPLTLDFVFLAKVTALFQLVFVSFHLFSWSFLVFLSATQLKNAHSEPSAFPELP